MKNSNHASGGKNAAAQDAMNVMVFENPEFGRVRTMLDENGEPLFCGKDVCDALGYARTAATSTSPPARRWSKSR